MSNLTLIFAIPVLLYIYLVGSTLFTIIKDKRDPVKTISWILVMIMIPVIGFLLYMLFGRNYRRRKIFSQKYFITSKRHLAHVSQQLEQFSLGAPSFDNEAYKNRDIVTLLLNNAKSPLTFNTHMEILNDGEQTFDKILYELQAAQQFIHLEYYILCDDNIGNQIADILIQKAQEGVEVRLIYDDVGSWSLPSKYVDRLREAGVKVAAFMPVIFPLFTSSINNRNHRKIIVIDGYRSFTGGINIADKYIYGNQKVGAWRDTHVYLEGEASLSLHSVFAADWLFLTGERLSKRRYIDIPEMIYFGNTPIQIAYSGPDSDWRNILQTFFCAITRAQRHIYISTPYFLPNDAMLTAIKVAAMSGLDVRIMLPKVSDSKLVYLATCSYISELLQAKVRVYLYEAGFNHSKIIMIDSSLSSIGTANMDVRSFDDNFEVSALIYSAEKTKELEARFLQDIELSQEIDLESWHNRKKQRSFMEGLARLFTPLL